MPQHIRYLYAGAPAVVANLWDVTDKDLDGVTQKLLEVSVCSGLLRESLVGCIAVTVPIHAITRL